MTDDLRPDHLISNAPPPEETAGMTIDDLLAALAARKDEILAAFTPERLVVVDNETIKRAADKISIAKAFLVKADGIRQEVKGPYDRASAAVQSRHANFVDPVVQAINRAEAAIRTCRADMRRRSEAAAAAQAAAEAALRQEAHMDCYQYGTVPAPEPEPAPSPPPAAPVQLGKVRGDYGTVVSDQAETTYTIDDPRKLPDEILRAPAVQKAMLAAVKQLAKLRPDIPGVSKSTATTDKIRRTG